MGSDKRPWGRVRASRGELRSASALAIYVLAAENFIAVGKAVSLSLASGRTIVDRRVYTVVLSSGVDRRSCSSAHDTVHAGTRHEASSSTL